MENKYVGWIVVGIAVLMTVIVLIFNFALKDIVGQTCSHGPSCTMYETISVQTWISFSIIAIIFVIGIIIMFSKPKEKIIIKTIREKKKKLNLEGLDKNEKAAIGILQKENGGMFQADLMEKLGIGKVGITRLLDKLEAKQLIERKRRGMNNIVIMKE
ncbi:Uncharacterised protein [uncultured archaeon]|nr:Uncharacterised protein [uncultured archaeon]